MGTNNRYNSQLDTSGNILNVIPHQDKKPRQEILLDAVYSRYKERHNIRVFRL